MQQLERYHTVFSTRKDYIQDNASYDKEESLHHLEEWTKWVNEVKIMLWWYILLALHDRIVWN